MLVENGFVRVVSADGDEFTFTPSFAHIAALGSPSEVVDLYVSLHGPRAGASATYILTVLCDQEDPTPAVGWHSATEEFFTQGFLDDAAKVLLAKHLMHHGLIGKARPSDGGSARGSGSYATEFKASEYVSAARVHLGLSSQDAEALSMTEFQTMFEMKFPQQANGGDTTFMPSREEYRAAMARLKG